MFDLNKIFSMTPDEIFITNQLQPIAKEAKRITELIRSTYKFSIGEDKIKVWEDRDGYNAEYLTHAGLWQARYLHQSYDVWCTTDEIFNLLVADFLVENGYVERYSDSEIANKAQIAGYFRKFAVLTEGKAESELI